MNGVDHGVVGIDVHLDRARRTGRRAQAAAGTKVLVNDGCTLNAADADQFVIDAGCAEGAKTYAVEAGNTDRCVHNRKRPGHGLGGLGGRQIKDDFSPVGAGNTDRQVFRALAFVERCIPMIDLAREIARAAGPATAIGAVQGHLVTILKQDVQNGPVGGYLKDVSGG